MPGIGRHGAGLTRAVTRGALLASFAALAVGAVVAHRYSNVAIAFDGEGYYAYLPAWLVEHDVSFRTYLSEHLSGNPSGIFFLQGDGNYLDKYSLGTAILILPFFLAGEAVGAVTGHGGGGFGASSQIALSLSMIVYCVIGLWALHRVLVRSFSPTVSLVTLGCLLAGTDLFHYVTHEPAFSHAYTFCLVALLLLAGVRWHEGDASLRLALGIGVLCGLIVEVRPVNVVLLPVVVLIGVTSWPTAVARARGLAAEWQRLAVITGAAAVTLIPQVAVWLIATGRPAVYSYGDNGEYFEFTRPHIVDVLFSFGPHGLLPYSPLLVLVPVGLFLLRRSAPHLVLALTVTLLLHLYFVASWYEWWYGGGFGLRPFIDALPLMAPPLAAVIAWARAPLARLAVGAVAGACVLVSLVLMYHYWRRQLDPVGVTPQEYVRVLLHR